MTEEKLKEVFEKTIKPKLGKIRDENKYKEIFVNVGLATLTKKNKKIREAELPTRVRPATHQLRKLSKVEAIDIIRPTGDGTVLTDPINDKTEIYNKDKLISEYLGKFQKHINNNPKSQKIVETRIGKTELQRLMNSTSRGLNFEAYRESISALENAGVNLKKEEFGYLNWRRLANKYTLHKKIIKTIGT